MNHLLNDEEFIKIPIPTENSSQEEKTKFAATTIDIIKDYLDRRFSGGQTLTETIFTYLFDSQWDHEDINHENKMMCQELLVLMANPKVSEMGISDTVTAAKVLNRIINLSESLEFEKLTAEMDIAYLENSSSDYLGRTKVLCKEYLREIEILEFKKQLDKPAA